MYLCLGDGFDMGSQMDINTCTDANTHFKEGVGLEGDLWGKTKSATQCHPCLHVTMQKRWSRHGEAGGHVYMY